MSKRSITTRSIHAGDDAKPMPTVSAPIVQTSTFEVESAQHAADLSAATAPEAFYTRWGNPNNAQAEAILADLEGTEACLVTASGMGAISAAVIGELAAGDHVVAGDSLYSGTHELLSEVLPRYGVESTFVDQTDLDQVRAAFRPTTRILYVETLTNPVLKVADLDALASIARERGARSMIDNTFATPANVRPIEHGFDVVLHSLTKYLNGHSDIIAGAILGSQATIDRDWYHIKVLGCSASPFDSWLLVRGLKSFGPRMERHNSGALAIARYLDQHPKVATVHYPGLESHPQHALASRQLAGYGGMLSFELDAELEAGRRFVESVELITLAVSLGGVETLIIHPATTTHAPVAPEVRERAGITDGLIRLSVGIEEPDDLIADLEKALDGI